jgi:hypothetical protein
MNRPQRVLTSVLIATILVLDASQARSQTVPLTASSPVPAGTFAPITAPTPGPAVHHANGWLFVAAGAALALLVIGYVAHCHKYPVACSGTGGDDTTDNFDDATKRHPAFQLGLRIPLRIIPRAASERT